MSEDDVMYAIARSQHQQQEQLLGVSSRVDYVERRCDEIAALTAQLEQIKKVFNELLEKNNIEIDSEDWLEVLDI